MKKTILLLMTLLFTQQVVGQSSEKYSRDLLKQDLAYLYATLEKSHYNLYIHTGKKEYDAAFKKLEASIPDSLSLLDTYRLFQPFVALSGLAHCTLDYPFGRVYGPYVQSGGKLFPLNVFIAEKRVLVKGNYSGNEGIERGDELLAINNRPMEEILTEVNRYLSGESAYLKSTVLDMISLPRMLWILEGTAENYTVRIKTKVGEVKEVRVNAIPAAEFEDLFSREEQLFQPGRTFKFIDGIAYIRPGTFMNEEAAGNTSDTETFEKGEFLHFIDSAFAAIHKNKADGLIIDLRNNAGGSNTFSDELLAYIADKPFRFFSEFKVKTSQVTKKFWKQVNDTSLLSLKEQILSHADGEVFSVEMPFHKPQKDSLQFKGKVLVLTNRYSYSQATVTAAMVQDYGFGTLVGEETADVPTTYGSVHQFTLPHTNIAVTYPKASIIRPSGDASSQGTVPDHRVEENIFTTEDEILEYALNLLKNTK